MSKRHALFQLVAIVGLFVLVFFQQHEISQLRNAAGESKLTAGRGIIIRGREILIDPDVYTDITMMPIASGLHSAVEKSLAQEVDKLRQDSAYFGKTLALHNQAIESLAVGATERSMKIEGLGWEPPGVFGNALVKPK